MTTPIPRALWCDASGLRIWRSPDSDFHADEVGRASAVYTDDVLHGIAEAGFNAVWMRGQLRPMMDSTVLPELNLGDAAARRRSVRDVIERGRRHGVAVYVFFNEPLALFVDDPFWVSRPDLGGQTHLNFEDDRESRALCTSNPEVRRYLRDAVDSVLRDLPGLGGVILITATEYFTHCWSHRARFSLDDGLAARFVRPFTCKRCADREPADIVGELVTIWRDAAAALPATAKQPRVLCWNWSWSQWYADPQQEVFDRLPDGIEMLLDFERGTQAKRRGRTLPVDEYALSVVGPSERFLLSKAVADSRGLPVNAKMQLGTTHEIATVPNLPLMHRLHAKLVKLSEQNVVGIMGTWNFGCTLTLNTAAVKLYCDEPDGNRDADAFLGRLAHQYLGIDDPADVIAGWRCFGEAFDHYPFSMQFLYLSPLNEAPAYPLRQRYDDLVMGGSWVAHEYGDRLEDCLTPGFTAQTTADAFAALADAWDEGLALIGPAFNAAHGDATQRRHRQEEWSCARMISLQMRSTAHVFAFHAWRQRRIESLGLNTPSKVPLDHAGASIMESELLLCEQARDLCQADARLGLHQECHLYFYNADMIERKRREMLANLDVFTAELKS